MTGIGVKILATGDGMSGDQRVHRTSRGGLHLCLSEILCFAIITNLSQLEIAEVPCEAHQTCLQLVAQRVVCSVGVREDRVAALGRSYY